MELNEDIILSLSNELKIKDTQIKAVLSLLNEGATIPFIARYRKEATGALDEDMIRAISKRFEYEADLLKRKEDVIRLIDEKGLLTSDLKKKILDAKKLVEVEDLYLPYKEKKKTKATEAKALGLEPLAKLMMTFPVDGDRLEIANKYVKDPIKDAEDAILRASYIIAEDISDNATFRKNLRMSLENNATIETKLKKDAVDEFKTFEIYYDYSEPIYSIKPHRVLAINRAENLKVITVNIVPDSESDIAYLEYRIIGKKDSIFLSDIKGAILDSYKRLILPSITREVRSSLTLDAEDKSINVFSINLKNLLLQAPIKGKVILGVDPAFRTGCKLAVIDKTGKLLKIDVIYPNEVAKGVMQSEDKIIEAKAKTLKLIKDYNVEIITIGNGTASRETEAFISSLIKENKLNCKYVIVSEAGASVYSASDIAKEEFPDLTLEKRSAVSIARRIQDPLSELVKIDPKSIGVGQYQHDVSQSKLSDSLDFVVSEAVNRVGVNVNTASKSLLTYVSGLNKSIAQNIVDYRNEFGSFKSRDEIKKVNKLGPKTYEQAIGFLRILEGSEPLDKTAIHPESYKIAKSVMKYLNIDPNTLGKSECIQKVDSANIDLLLKEFNTDKYTMSDILDNLKAPLRDIRDSYDTPLLKESQKSLEDLNIGDMLEGTVRNIVDFGAFIDCGVHDDGLLHISKMSKKFIEHPSDILSVGDLVKVYVVDIDLNKRRLSLSLFKDELN